MTPDSIDFSFLVLLARPTSCAGLLGRHNTIASNEIIQSGVMAAMLSLICSAKHKSQMAGLQVLAVLALVSDAAAQKLMSQRLLTALQVSQQHSPVSLDHRVCVYACLCTHVLAAVLVAMLAVLTVPVTFPGWCLRGRKTAGLASCLMCLAWMSACGRLPCVQQHCVAVRVESVHLEGRQPKHCWHISKQACCTTYLCYTILA